MKPLSVARLPVLSVLVLAHGMFGCSSEDEQSQRSRYDTAAIEAAPAQTKALCDEVCTATDQIRHQGCGATTPITHFECYAICVDRYLDHPECADALDAANACVRDKVCMAQTECSLDMVSAMACMEGWEQT
ncbi:MAG TPA: hypothetical protein VKP30_20535 [Polyangiaceae bacterium]|nr:hypothetical protein [Polyangiaceae bacterium]